MVAGRGQAGKIEPESQSASSLGITSVLAWTQAFGQAVMVLLPGGTYPVLRLEIRSHNGGDWTLGDQIPLDDGTVTTGLRTGGVLQGCCRAWPSARAVMSTTGMTR